MKLLCNFVFFISLVVVSPSFGHILAEGKTKIVRSYDEDPSLAIFEAKDDITAGDGAKHDVIQGKNEFATQTTCNVFRLLSDCGLPVAFRKQLDSHSFLGDLCQMVQYEVVVRREAHGSYIKRHPYLEKGHIFPKLIVEFFLKTSNRNWMGTPIPKDDPLIHFTSAGAELFRPDSPVENQTPFLILSDYPLKDLPELFEQITTIAKQTFLILEKAWQLENGRLVDFKVEFGINSSGELLLADVIDNDSWRVIQNQQYIDKQIYRDGGAIDQVAALYRHVSKVTGNFKLPDQQLILCGGSEWEPFLASFSNDHLKVSLVDKTLVQEKVREIPDSVAIASADSSFAANTMIPVITTLAGRDKSVMTVSEPQSAVLAALKILSARNPLLYMQLRLKQEERME